MSKKIAAALPGLVTNYWQRIANVDDSRESTYALFELYRDPRARILSATDQEQNLVFDEKEYDSALLKRHLISRWVRLERLGQGRWLDPEWSERISSYINSDLVRAVVSSAGPRAGGWQDPPLIDLMMTAGHVRASSAISRGALPAICISIFGERLSGSVIRAMREIAETSNCSAGDNSMDIVETFDRFLSESVNCKIDAIATFSIGEMLKVEVPSWRIPAQPHATEIFSHNSAALRTLWWLLAVLSETYETAHPLDDMLGRLSEGFQELAWNRRRCRDFMAKNTDVSGNWTGPRLRNGPKKHATDIRASDLKRWGYDLPENALRTVISTTSWATSWCLGLTNLVEWPRLDLRSKIEQESHSKEYLAPYVMERWCDFATNVPPVVG